jgi:antitoxin YefM
MEKGKSHGDWSYKPTLYVHTQDCIPEPGEVKPEGISKPVNYLTIPHIYCTVSLYILEDRMTIQTTYTQARDGLAKLLDQVTHNREVVIIQRRGEEEVAMIAASELGSLMETAYLLRSPANAERLLTALGQALKGEGETQSLETLRHQVNLEL